MTPTAAAPTSKALEVFKEMRDVLAPFPEGEFRHLLPTAYQERSPLFRPAVSVVRVNPNDPRDIYPTPGGGSTVCLHSAALERIGNAVGLDWHRTHFDVDRAEPFVVTAHVSGAYVDSLGIRRTIAASATSDLRDGSVTARVLKGGLETARQFISERTESRARNRAIRKVANLPSAFTREELAKPFVALRFRLDENDPDVKRALIAQGTGAADTVYGRQPEGERVDAGHARADEEVLEGQLADTTAQAAEPEPEIPDEAPAAAALDVPALRAHLEGIRAKLRGADGKASDLQVLDIGVGLRDILQLGERVEKSRWPAVRLAVLAALWGVGATKELTAHQASATLTWLGTDDGKAQVRALFDGLIAADVIGPAQQTLAGAADVLK